MAVEYSEQGLVRIAYGARTSLRLLTLRFGPMVMALVVEPWAAAAIALDLLRHTPGKDASSAADKCDKDIFHRQRPVLNAAITLLGLSMAIVGVLQYTNQSGKTYSDEVAWIAAGFMLGSIALSCSGMRGERLPRLRLADAAFLAGMATLLLSIAAAAWQLP